MEFLIPENENNEQRPTFENTTYSNNHKKKQILTIRSSKSNFNLKLKEPLRIEKFSDVFLDSFGTFHIGPDHANAIANKQFFILKIDQFNLQQKSNIDDFNNTIVIPNESSTGTGFTSHKSKKHNYVSTIQPGVITNISGTLKDIVSTAILSNHNIDITGPGGGWADSDTIIIHYIDGNGIRGSVTLTASSSGPETSTSFNDKAVGGSGVATSIRVAFNLNNLVDITAVAVSAIVLFEATGNAEILSISGSYLDGHATEYHPHFFAEFAIIEKD